MAPLFLLAWTALATADAGVLSLPVVEVPLPEASVEPLPTSPLVRDPSAAVSVISAVERRAEAKDAAELVSTAPGTTVQDAGGAGQRKTVSLRGAAPNAVLVLLDGVPLAGPGAAMDLSRVPLAALERIEVLRGGGGRYGPGAMGGVVNLVTRAPDGSTRLFADVTGGSFVTTQALVGGATPLLGGEGLVLLHGLRSEGTFDFRFDQTPTLPGDGTTLLRRHNNGALSGGALLRYRAHLGATDFDVLAEGQGESRGLAGPVQNPSPGASQETWRGTLSARSVTRFEAGGSLALLGWGRADSTRLSGSLFGGAYQQLEVSAGAEAVYSRLFAGRHGVTALVTAGGDWLREPSASNPSWGRVGAMLSDEVAFFGGDLTVTPSARVDVAGPFVVVSPKLGVQALLPLGLSLRANAGQASRPPSFLELYVVQGTLLPNAALRPERALTADLGVGLERGKVTATVTGFASIYEDLIAYEYYPPNLARPYNFQAASVAGVEVEAKVTPWRSLEASAAYTFLSTQNLRDDPRYYLKALPYRPAHRLHARVVGGVDWLKARAEVLLQSEQFQNRTQTLALPARAFVNVGATARPWRSPELTVGVELKNLLDVQTQDLDGYPLPPRSLFVTLGVAWGRT